MALVDSSLWFMKVGVAMLLLVGALSHEANSNPQYPIFLAAGAPVKVELVKRLQERKSRRFSLCVHSILVMDK